MTARWLEHFPLTRPSNDANRGPSRSVSGNTMLALPILRNPRDRSHPDVVRSA